MPRGDAATASSIPTSLDQTDAILRISAYHRKDFDLAVIWFSDREHEQIATSVVSTFREPTTTLGQMERLPLELMNAICMELDIASLFAFRQVNLRARQIVGALAEYRTATTYALNCLCALLRTKSASWVSLSDFYRVLCSNPLCSICHHNYGNLVSLLTWSRCCSACLERGAPAVRTITTARAKQILQLSTTSLKKLRTLDTLPGIYSMRQFPRTRRARLISAQAGFTLSQQDHTQTEPSLDRFGSRACLDFMSCCALPYFDPARRQVQRGISCAGCELALEDSNFNYAQLRESRDIVYSRSSFLEHFQSCEQAQSLWRSSEEGRIQPANLPYACKRGGDFRFRE